MNGLSTIEVEKNQSIYGLNKLKEGKKPNFFLVFISEFRDWLVIILIIAAILSVLIDPHSLFESIIIFSILLINAFIGAFEEIKASNTLDSLKKVSEHKSTVIRDGEIKSIPSSELTISDIVLLEKGNVIDADMKLIEAIDFKVDESSLTGESRPVIKNIDDEIYSMTFIVSGYGKAIVNKIGMKTKIGIIAESIIKHKSEPTPLELKLNQIGKIIGIIAIIICMVVFFIEIALNIKPLEAFKSAISLAVAAIPEGLATIVTVCLAIGVGKMANQNVIVKRLEAVETLGCSTVVCTDKTGTLTYNKEEIVAVYEDKYLDLNNLNQISNKLLNYLYMSTNPTKNNAIDPIDKAILELYKKHNNEEIYFDVVEEVPFSSDIKYSSVLVRLKNSEILLFKGAYDILVELVKNKPNIEIDKVFNMMMEKGYRVICIATELKILALVAMQDLPKEDVYNTILKANEANVKTVMITGDHVKTAFAIAKDLNITNNINETITKEKLDKLSEEELVENIENYKVYARVNPIDKVRIIKAWQKKGNIVAMTGDGVNDAPALKKAEIGCAMGSGTEIAKESADLIIVDSNYSSIIKAIKNGRNIYENIKNCTRYLLASNIGEVLTILIIILFSLIFNVNLGIPLAAIQLLWINVITDSLPAFGLGLMEENNELMKNPPRKSNDGFFSNGVGIEIIFFGFCIGLLTVISYLIGLKLNPIFASTMAFVTISTAQLIHAYNCSTNKSLIKLNIFKNKFLNYSFIIGCLLIILVIYLKPINDLFKLKPLPTFYLLISVFNAFLILVISEIRKKIIKNNQKKPK